MKGMGLATEQNSTTSFIASYEGMGSLFNWEEEC